MRAAQLITHGEPGELALNEVTAPEAAAGHVVIEVRACGLNHLDLWLEAGRLPVSVELPRIPGGEVAGRIVAVGEGVDGWRVGDRVAVQSNLFCGECEFCRQGEENLCLKGELLGIHRDGGFAEKVVVPARNLVALPNRVDYETSAALTLAGSTALHMLTDRVEVKAGDWVLVIGGASGVGSNAIQIARHLGARVISTGSTESKRALAEELGAEAVVSSEDLSWPSSVRRITGKRGVKVVVEHVGGTVLEQAFHCLARGGTVVTCGATAGHEVALKLWPFFVKEHRLIGSYGRTRADMVTTLDWAAAGRIRPVLHRIFSLSEVRTAFDKMRHREVQGKIVVNP